MASEMNAKKICDLFERIYNSDERSNAENEWDEITEYMLTNQSGVFRVDIAEKGGKKTTRIYDQTAGIAARDLSAAIHSVMTNPAAPWLQLRFAQDDVNEDDEAKEWLEDAKNKLIDELNLSNFNTEVSKGYRFFTTIANMALLHEEEDYNENGTFGGFRFKAMHQAELAWTENAKGVVDTLFRKFKLTARQAVERWGEKVSEKVKTALEKRPNEEFEFLQAILPRDMKIKMMGRRAVAKDRPFANLYIDLEEKRLLEEDGYYEFPVHIVRWETLPGEVYGRGPGNLALPDVRTLNKAVQLTMHAWAKAIDPPLIVTQRDILGTLDLRPRGITTVKTGVKDSIALIPQGTQQQYVEIKREEYENKIKQIFFLDKLLLPPRDQTGEMTAFEVAQRIEQMQRVLGPTLGRLNSELLDPLVQRCFNMMLRGGAFKEVPASLAESGAKIQIEYVNPLARSQKISDVTNIQSWVQDLLVLAGNLGPEAADYIDMDGIAKHTAKIRGVPDIAVKSDKEVEQARQSRQQQAEAMQALDAGVKAADIQSKNAKANRDGGGEGV